MWLNRDKVIPVMRNAVGYAPGPTWDRRNKLVLYTYLKRFRKLTNWFKREKLFDYDLSKPDELLKFHSFLLIEPLSDHWLETPTAAQFRERCVRAERLAYDHFRLPHTRGAAPVPHLADDDGEQEAAEEEAEDEAEADESNRMSLAGFPPRCTLVWSKLDGVVGKVPDAALRSCMWMQPAARRSLQRKTWPRLHSPSRPTVSTQSRKAACLTRRS